MNYAADYKLDDLLEAGGASTEEQLVQYIIKTMLKGLPIEVPYDLTNPALNLCADMDYENVYVYTVE